jgi:hypothetical protein
MRWNFVDRIIKFEPWHNIAALKAGSLEEYSLMERWGQAGQAPAVLSLESSVQAARWLVEASSAFVHSLELLELEGWAADEGLRPGERLFSDVRLTEKGADGRLTFGVRQKRLAPAESCPTQLSPEGGEYQIKGRLNLLADKCRPDDRQCLWHDMASYD